MNLKVVNLSRRGLLSNLVKLLSFAQKANELVVSIYMVATTTGSLM